MPDVFVHILKTFSDENKLLGRMYSTIHPHFGELFEK